MRTRAPVSCDCHRVRLLFMSVGMLVHVLKNGIARTKTERAAAVHDTVLAASGSNSPTQLVSGTTLLSLGQMLDLPILPKGKRTQS